MRTIIDLIDKFWQHQLVRFLCVGSFNTLLDFVMLNLLYGWTGLPALLANTISVSIGITISYFLNHRLVFRHPHPHSLTNYLRFFLITGLSVLLIQNLVIFSVTRAITVDPSSMTSLGQLDFKTSTLVLNLAKALAVLAGMSWNFLLYKHMVFRRRTNLELLG